MTGLPRLAPGLRVLTTRGSHLKRSVPATASLSPIVTVSDPAGNIDHAAHPGLRTSKVSTAFYSTIWGCGLPHLLRPKGLTVQPSRLGVSDEFLPLIADEPTGDVHVAFLGDDDAVRRFNTDVTQSQIQQQRRARRAPSLSPRLLCLRSGWTPTATTSKSSTTTAKSQLCGAARRCLAKATSVIDHAVQLGGARVEDQRIGVICADERRFRGDHLRRPDGMGAESRGAGAELPEHGDGRRGRDARGRDRGAGVGELPWSHSYESAVDDEAGDPGRGRGDRAWTFATGSTRA